MKSMERILPVFVFVVLLGSNLLNISHFLFVSVFFAVFWPLVAGVFVFGLIKLLWWWVQR
ncbi:hypothetical protein WZ78_07885 [Leuconostoc mesenteroides subsp. dextranicum]|uniref:Uncharacterized protein n=1 Tax=Leuconostoc mesenteroides subsp. cremoris ATCC 19254 TaxID=586220 RepID=C2KK38_LEUMC|nr:hypothetical protein [Leuconostoc mesenteroides]EEJ42385.1 hypothetical protein HMPREF0555_1004 [Leuconostoc mesenteroides subsp. cremoris ATCC 19254]EQC82083.1 hypothetical protein LMT8_01980 [Leuconostoc mesenteroides subsp. cremoris TIFN8]ORI37279.1 hypothetical protein BMR90_05770 [Leuconostoc mesenteroides subsp. cremoris]KMY78883.1 hypothetical protein WZ79_01070 [Leuconostoc mesenteroides subsp. mesenteroides]KMY81072.1 hypothetical protein WZ78_07885 [Leuconostoc mesenteroides subsp